MDNLYWLDRIQTSQRPLVGNKAFNLSQLLQRGYPVVPGFVVPAIAFWEFIELLSESNPLLADWPHSSFYVNVDNPRQLQLVARQIRQEIKEAPIPAVWESALLMAAEVQQAPAMILHPSLSLISAGLHVEEKLYTGKKLHLQPSNPIDLQPFGILDSHICPRQPEALAFSLKQVWAELFRARSLFYYQRIGNGLPQLSLAVLVQPIWDAIASGTLLADSTSWHIQSTWGLREALLKGEVFPDYYQLQKETGTEKARSLGSKTRAYRLSNRQEPYTPIKRGIEAYLLSEEQQKQYALEEKHLKQLIELSQRLTAEVSSAFSLEWTIYQMPENSEPQVYLTHFIPPPRAITSHPSPPLEPPTLYLIRGLPAAAGRVTAPAQLLMAGSQNPEEIIAGKILVAQSITPDWLPLLKKAAGVVTERGGMTCHAAIIARELGIPAVVSAAGVTQLIQSGEFLLVDGERGEIHRLGTGKALKVEGLSEGQSAYPLKNNFKPANLQPYFPIATQLLVNLSQTTSLEKIVGLPVDGVGLLRSELMMLEALDNLHPTEWLRLGLEADLVKRLAQSIVQFAAAFAPRPVLYRSLDWRSHEFQFLSGATSVLEPEVNPMLGLRGTRRYLSDPTYFDLELAALGQVHSYGYTNVRLMLPFVRTVEEFTFCRRRAEQAGLTQNPHFQLWIMAEVPSVLFLLPDYVEAGVQGISIGTNDLTQLLLAVDRDQGQLDSVLDERHPAVKRAVKQLIETARLTGIPCSICGQAPAQYPELIELLVQWGITSISVDMNDVETTYNAIARAEQRLLLDMARKRGD